MKKWLFNPFEIIAGWSSLFLGLLVLVLTAICAYYANIHLDGVLDLHLSDNNIFLVCIIEGFINWFSLALFIYIAGLFFSKSSIRIIDVLGTQSMARFPFLVTCLLSLGVSDENFPTYIQYNFLHKGPPATVGPWDIAAFVIITIFTLMDLVWMVTLMYKSYSVSCNVKGTRAVISFIACIVFSEILSKVLITLIYNRFYE